MRIPFEIPPKGMKDQNETGSEIFGFVIFMKQTEDNALDCLKKKTEKRSVFQKKVSEFRINGKNTVAVLDIDDLKRHGSGALLISLKRLARRFTLVLLIPSEQLQ